MLLMSPISAFALLGLAAAQQFEIPAEMLGQMFGGGGGMMGGGGRGRKKDTEWSKSENSAVAPEFEWLINTEWKGKSAKYLLLRDGHVESPLKECEQENQCLWAANGGKVMINTPTLKVIKFNILGLEAADKKKLDGKDEKELATIKLETEKASKSGKKSQLNFERVAKADESQNIISRNLYEILGVEEDIEQGAIKSKYRRLSVTMHPDKGGDPAAFAEMKDAYEVLANPEYRKFYDVGGIQLVRNVETAWKEVEGQKAQMESQLDQVPKNHPQYQQFKQQIEQQKKQFDGNQAKQEIDKKLRSDEIEVPVPVSAQELYTGVSSKTYEFKRLRICKGCRADPEKPECAECGRCPPEKIQVPQYSNTPFGKQVTGMKEKEQESRERCKEFPVKIENLRIPRGAKEGATLKHVSDIGHETPGKIPGKVHFVVARGSADDIFAIAEADLHTVLHISVEEALFGFSRTFKHLGDESVTIQQAGVTKPGAVFVVKKKGLSASPDRGDLYVRIEVDMPTVKPKSATITLKAPDAGEAAAKLTREDNLELRDGSAWKKWNARAEAKVVQAGKKGKEEL